MVPCLLEGVLNVVHEAFLWSAHAAVSGHPLSALEVAACPQHALCRLRSTEGGGRRQLCSCGWGGQQHAEAVFPIFLHTFQIPDFSSDLQDGF